VANLNGCSGQRSKRASPTAWGENKKYLFISFLQNNVTEAKRSYAMTENNEQWYALYTKPRWEKKVAKLLDEQGIENYCPINKVTRQWSDRKKVVLEPVFKGYVFVKISEANKWEVKKVNGVLNYVYWLGKPATIREDEIQTIRKFLNEFTDVEVTDLTLKVNSTVRIKTGVLMNYQGVLVELIGNKARVKIESMGLQLSAQFDKRNLENIN
jgi:transcription antitermination factor NusG